MKKALGAAVPAALSLAALAVFAAAPGRASSEQKRQFSGRNFAHRGLHRADKSVPENSMAAFRAAVEHGYGIELDARLTRDGRVVVFHDDDLGRLCLVRGRIEDKTLEQIKKLRLCGTDEGIPLLSQVLELVSGRVPVIIEIKGRRRSDELCAHILDMLRCYSGDVCVESFDPLIVRWWRKNAPEVLRGVLSAPPEALGTGFGRLGRFLHARLLTNFLSRPQFIAYGLGSRRPPAAFSLCRLFGAMKCVWTSRGFGCEEHSDMVIFEYYRPRPKFK